MWVLPPPIDSLYLGAILRAIYNYIMNIIQLSMGGGSTQVMYMVGGQNVMLVSWDPRIKLGPGSDLGAQNGS